MCGVIGAVSQRDIVRILLEGLCRLEYRGYDSAGLAVVNHDGNLQNLRRVGKINSLIKVANTCLISGNIGIAHTRWATHGQPTENNAHPHVSSHIAVVHNGIIENYEFLREQLRSYGYHFISDTDTEVIAHLIHWELQKKQDVDLVKTMQRIVTILHGVYGIVVMNSNNPSKLVAVNFGSPIIVGFGIKENFFASDQLALLPITSRFMFLEKGDISEITINSVKVWNQYGQITKRPEIQSKIKHNVNDKKSYKHYMKKEIYDQAKAIQDTLINNVNNSNIILSELSKDAQKILSRVKHMQIVACGTSYHSAMLSRYWFEDLANIPCAIDIASEFRYRKPIVYPDSLLITISQSGETADTLAALKKTKNYGYLGSLTICNVANSSLVRESDIALITCAGIEISVASTKSFTTQLTMLLILVVLIGRQRMMNKFLADNIILALRTLPNKIKQILAIDKTIESLAKDFLDKEHAIFLGRGNLYPIAMEGALKLKEISYIHAEAYAAGELKHGPIALIDNCMPVIVIVSNNQLLKKIKSNIEEVYARGGQLYIFAEQNSGFIAKEKMKIIYLPKIEEFIMPIAYTIPLQLLAYHVALIKGTDIDQPRNLAKSVTVE